MSTTLTADGLMLRYVVHGDPAAIRLPEPRPAQAADGLWQHTCCEAFIAPAAGTAYREFNFSPSGEWAAYSFTDYRARDIAYHAPHGPRIELQQLANGFELTASLAPALLPAGPAWQIGLTVVIEAADGSKSYWALAHAAAQPDFHLRPSFSLNLKAARP
ncbi:MAG: hypothetical protein H6R15_1406 [Proteobacteria bacterium]|nr:hypothetical protein [Pseudomonadota bacterium]